MKNSAMVMTIQDPASQRLTWYKPPLTVLVIKKVRDVSVLSPFVQLVRWLIEEKRMVVFVEQSVMDDSLLLGNADFSGVKEKLMTFRDGKDDLTDKIDFIVCLGGDGTLLYASLLFQQSVPPVMAFHLGSLGFLTPFEFENFQEQVTNVLEGHAALTLRSRLRCIIMRKNEEVTKAIALPLQHRSVPRRQTHHLRTGRWSDRVDTDGQYSVRSGSRRVHDPPFRTCHHGHAHLPPLPLLQAHRGAGGGRAQDFSVARQQKHGLGVVRRPQPPRAVPRRQPAGDDIDLPGA
uniref:NAD(+) kinase n=1 Tax=Graphocephala atropunctata TaxID=36148 RepID=A0A1B6LXD7_9HEMI